MPVTGVEPVRCRHHRILRSVGHFANRCKTFQLMASFSLFSGLFKPLKVQNCVKSGKRKIRKSGRFGRRMVEKPKLRLVESKIVGRQAVEALNG